MEDQVLTFRGGTNPKLSALIHGRTKVDRVHFFHDCRVCASQVNLTDIKLGRLFIS